MSVFSRVKGLFGSRSSGSLGGGALQLTGAKFITLLIGTVSSMMMARLRTKADFGTYTTLLMTIRTLSVFLMMGLPNAINYFLARAKTREQKQHFLSVYYTFSTALSVIIGLTLFLSLPWLVQFFGNPELSNYAYFLFICPWIYITSGCVDHLLIAYRKTRALSLFRITNSIFLLSIILFAELFASWGWGDAFRIYVLLYVLCEGAYAAAAYFFARNYSGALRLRFDFKLLSRILAFSLPIGLASSVSTLNGEIDKLFIAGILKDPEALAVYEYGARSLPFYVIPAAITSVLTPLIVRIIKKGQTSLAVGLWNRVVEFSYGILVFAVSMLICFAPQAVELLYSEKYLDCVPVFIIFRLTLLLRVTYFGMLLNATGRTKFIFVSSCCSLAFNVALNAFFFFCTDFGTIGLALSTVLSSAAMNLTQLIATCHVTKTPFSKIMPWKQMGALTLTALSLGAIGQGLLQLTLHVLQPLLPAAAGLAPIAAFFVSNLSTVLAVVFGTLCTLLYLYLYRDYIKTLWKFINSFKMADASKDDDEEDAPSPKALPEQA